MTHQKHLSSPRSGQSIDVEFTPSDRPMAMAKPRHKRAFASTVAIMSVVALGGAFAIPTAAAMTTAAPVSSVGDSTLYDSAVASAQSLTLDDVVLESSFGDTTSYEVYVAPPPEPEPEPEPATVSGDDEAAEEETYFAPPAYTGGGSKEDWMTAAGIAASDWGYVDFIVSSESGWNPNAVNPSSGASGLVQALPCEKVPGSCFDPVDNLRWANGYAVDRYGSWADAYNFWVSNHWW